MRGSLTGAAAVTLRAPRPADHAMLLALRQDSRLQHLLLANPCGDAGDVVAWLERRQQNGRLWIIADAQGQGIGFVQLMDIHRAGRHARFGICLAAEARGAGAGRAAMTALLAESVRLGLRKLLCEVRADNRPARALYVALGFREVGILRAHYNDGTAFYDVVLMETLLDGPA
jgi:RimJ/RimL family protein N-acetyltransferase